MGYERIRKEIDGFIASDQPSLLCLTGKWGGGKTHLWREAIKQSSKQKDYLYVSLFGLRSGGEIWEAILGSRTPKEASKLITGSPFLRRFVDPIGLMKRMENHLKNDGWQPSIFLIAPALSSRVVTVSTVVFF